MRSGCHPPSPPIFWKLCDSFVGDTVRRILWLLTRPEWGRWGLKLGDQLEPWTVVKLWSSWSLENILKIVGKGPVWHCLTRISIINYITSQSCPVQSLWPTWLLWCSLWCHHIILSFAASAKAVTLATTGTYSGPLLLLAGGNGCAPVSDMTGGMGARGNGCWAGCWGCCVFYMRTRQQMFAIICPCDQENSRTTAETCFTLLLDKPKGPKFTEIVTGNLAHQDWPCGDIGGSQWWCCNLAGARNSAGNRPAQSLCSWIAASCRSMIIQKTSFIWSILALFGYLLLQVILQGGCFQDFFVASFHRQGAEHQRRAVRCSLESGHVWASGGALCRRHHTTRPKKGTDLGFQ